jgi:CubicO group peptidase (beta-lactamase class C family)
MMDRRTARDYLTHFERHHWRGQSIDGRRGYRNSLARFAAFLQREPGFADFTPETFQQFERWLQLKVAKATRRSTIKMRQLLQHAIAFAVVLAALHPTGVCADERNDRLEQYLKACVDVLQFNGTVLVKHQGQILLSRGYGFANVEHQVPNAPQTKFRIGSITKPFTSMLVLLQQQAGKLSVEDPINKYLSDPPATWAPIKIHHLLQHTSGISEFTESADYLTKQAHLGRPEKLVSIFRDQPLKFAPGERHEYSNSGYLLLGLILEQVAGRSYESLVQQQIFGQLGMCDSGYDRHAPIVPHRAAGYSRVGGSIRNAPYVDIAAVQAAGALYSTVEDLSTWDDALTAGKLLTPELYEKLYTPGKGKYAYGWVVESRSGRRYLWHTGAIDGFSSSIARCPEERTCVVVLSNFDSGAPHRMGNELMAIAFGEEYRLPRQHQAIDVDPAKYDAYVGRYELDPETILIVSRNGDQLQAAIGGEKLDIFPESQTDFFFKATDAECQSALENQPLIGASKPANL